MKITMKELAERINGREYREEITKDDIADAKESGLVIVYGASDDCTEFEGAISDEAGAWGGATHEVTTSGDIFCVQEEHANLIKAGWTPPKIVMEVTAEWSPTDPAASWLITANVPYESFDIMEDGELYCRGIVVDFAAAKAAAA